MLVLENLSGQMKEQRDEQRDLLTVLNDRLTTTENETNRLHERLKALDKDGIQELQKQIRNMGGGEHGRQGEDHGGADGGPHQTHQKDGATLGCFG